MGRMTNLQVANAERQFKENPTVKNELNLVNWKLRQLSESGGMPYYNKEENVCIMPSGREGSSDHIRCLSISNQYPQLKQKQKLLEIKIQQTKEIISSVSKKPEIINSKNLSTVGASALPLLVIGVLALK